jgi:chromosome partitioning protein
MTTVIAVANVKGGVGKTTTCLSLGGSLAEAGHSVMLVDLDPQAHLTISLGVKPESLRRTIGDVLLGQGTLVAMSQETKVANLDLVPANNELVIIDKVLYGRPGYEYRLREGLEHSHFQPYDMILFDCPPAVGTLTLNALTAADFLLIPFQCEYYAIRSLQQVLELVLMVRRKTNPRLSYRLLVTMFDVRNKIHRVLLERVQARFPDALLQSIIQIDTRLRESPAFGLPVTQHAPQSRAAQQYRELAQELLALPRPATAPARSDSLPLSEALRRLVPSRQSVADAPAS